MYEPKPIETSNVDMPLSIDPLLKRLAKHNHDVWAQQRLADGWTYGPQRDDSIKKHPCLIPYDQLPESEKEYDRNTAAESLKAIVALGHRIEPPPTETTDGPDSELLNEISDPQTDLKTLLTIWRERNELAGRWRHAVEMYRGLARRLVSGGAPLVGLEVVNEALGRERWQQDVLLRQLQGLALARIGAINDANVVLQDVWSELQNETDVDKHVLEETLGALARTHKELGLLAATKHERNSHLSKACIFYSVAYQRTGGFWTGINVATLATLLGDQRAVAQQVQAHCHAELERLAADSENDNDYWVLATLGEVALNLQDWSQAEHWYKRATIAAKNRFGDLISTRRQAKLLLEYFHRDVSVVDEWLPIPQVAIFAGHMIDQTARQHERFPPRVERQVYEAIRDRLKEENALIGFSSAACGADILFQEAIRDLGGQSYIVLPYPDEEFRHDSVDIITDADWGQRFETVVKEAVQVVYASNTKLAHGSVSYEYANQLIHGLALVKAKELDTTVLGLAVWDGRSGDGLGGTATHVARWHQLDVPVHQVDLSRLPPTSDTPLPVITRSPQSTERPHRTPASSSQPLMSMLFADVVGFSKLADSEVPRFVERFLGRIADEVQQYVDSIPDSIPVRETWGDGLYFAFSTVQDAGNFALRLSQLVNDTDWLTRGFSKPLKLRIALHAGPAYLCKDPITGLPKCSGTHVIRAARLEPQTPPGQVYASEAFAALAALDNVTDFVCHSVKLLDWAKHYGTFPTYAVHRQRNADFPDQPPPPAEQSPKKWWRFWK